MKRIVIVFCVFASGTIGWLLWQQHRPVPFVVSGFIEADQIRVGTRVGGRVAEVSVSEGQIVKEGERLFSVSPYDLQQQLAQGEATLAAARAEHQKLKDGYRPEEIEQAKAARDQATAAYEKLKAGPRPKEIEIAQQRLKLAEANLELATFEHKRLVAMSADSTATPVELNHAIREMKVAEAQKAVAEGELALLLEGNRAEDVARAKAALAEAEQSLQLIEHGYRKEDVAKADAEVKAAEGTVEATKIRIGELTVTSPCNCRVEAIELRPGDLVGSNAPTASLLDISRLWVRAYVPEGRLSVAKIGAVVPVRVDSCPGRLFKGTISFIAREAEFTPRNVQTPEERSKQVFRIKVTILDHLDELRVGMAADVLFDEIVPP